MTVYHEIFTELPDWFFFLFATIFGASIGSFLNVLIYRFPRNESLVSPGSHCPHCDTSIKAWQNIPVLSWILLGGKCSNCKGRISARYPLVELLGVLVTVLPIAIYGYSFHALAGIILGYHLIALGFIDLDTKTIPDHIVLPLAIFGLLFAFLQGGWIDLLFAFLRGAITGGSLLLIFFLYKKLRQVEGGGSGDITMLAAVAIYVSSLQVPILFLFSAFTALAAGLIYSFAKKHDLRELEIPFAPSIAVSAYILYVFEYQLDEFMIGLSKVF